MALFQRGGTGSAGRVGFITGRIAENGAATNVLGGTLTCTWDADGSGVLVWTPPFRLAGSVQIAVIPTSATGGINFAVTGIDVASAGIVCAISAGTATTYGASVIIIGEHVV